MELNFGLNNPALPYVILTTMFAALLHRLISCQHLCHYGKEQREEKLAKAFSGTCFIKPGSQSSSSMSQASLNMMNHECCAFLFAQNISEKQQNSFNQLIDKKHTVPLLYHGYNCQKTHTT